MKDVLNIWTCISVGNRGGTNSRVIFGMGEHYEDLLPRAIIFSQQIERPSPIIGVGSVEVVH